jgi:glutathione S-transferase
MQLFASATSPYARKVRIALSELGFSDRVEIVPTAATEDEGFRAVNPLGKVPALALDDGTVLYDSLVILDWLDHAAGGGRLIPRDPEARNAELRRHALANGMLDAAFSAAMELRRPEEHRSAFRDVLSLWTAGGLNHDGSCHCGVREGASACTCSLQAGRSSRTIADVDVMYFNRNS